MGGVVDQSSLPEAETGCLLIADISGYTTYLQDSELEHAQDVLADLLETIVGSLTPTFRIAKLEGDAVFAYAFSQLLDAAVVLDTVEQTYVAFRSRVRDVVQATTCDCQACRLIPTLDLKVVAHDGRFVRRDMAGTEELTGTDVVVVHRLLKNSVKERLRLEAYALFTDACVTALGIDAAALGMVEHRETYDGLGEVVCYVEDLEARWTVEQERRRVVIAPVDAEVELSWRFPVPVETLWVYQTDPRKRLLWQTEFSRIDQTNPGGRRGAGTTNHCVHGRQVIVEEILDWRPYDYFTQRVTAPMIGPWISTMEFHDLEDGGAELRFRPERLRGWRRLLWALMGKAMRSSMDRNMERLSALLTGSADEDEPPGPLTSAAT